MEAGEEQWLNHTILRNSPFYSCLLCCQAFEQEEEAKVDLVMIQTLLLFKCTLLCYHAN